MEKEKEMAKKYYWLKLKDNFFNQKEVKKLRRIAGGDTYTIIYLKMQLLSIKKDGIIEFEGTEKDLAEQLSYEIDEDGDNIQTTLLFLKANNLIEEISENNFLLTKVPDCIGKEGASAERVRRHRERKALLEKEKEQKMLQCNGEVTNSNDVVIESNTEIEIEKEIEKEIDDVQIIKCYEENIGIITPASAELLLSYTDTFNQKIICEAIKKSAIANKRSCKYIVGILKDWKNKGLKTLLDIETEQENFKNKKGNRTETDEEKMARKLKALEGDSSD